MRSERKRVRALCLQAQDYEYRVKLRAQKLEQMRRLGEEKEGLVYFLCDMKIRFLSKNLEMWIYIYIRALIK